MTLQSALLPVVGAQLAGMTPDSRYSLDDQEHPSGRRLLHDRGHPLATTVDGAAIEAQFATADGYSLLFLSGSSPYEEGLHIYLVGPDGELIDSIEGGIAYAGGILEMHEITGSSAEFTFFASGARYVVRILAKAQVRFWLPSGFRYKARAVKHWLELREVTAKGALA